MRALFTILLMITAMNCYLFAFSGGTGTSQDPFQVSDVDELQSIIDYPDSYFIQITDIDASSTASWNSGEGFMSLSDYDTPFTGSYDGNGYSIDGLTINRSGGIFQSLFGFMSGAEISNVTLTDVSIIGGGFIGGLAGYCESSDVIGCSSQGSVTGINSIGGLMGEVSGSTSVSRCFSSGTVEGTVQIGGLIGSYSSSIALTDCYSISDVTTTGSDPNIGGLIGLLIGDVQRCYSAGSVTVTTNSGGAIGYKQSGTVTDSFWDVETSGQSTSAGGVGKTTAEMQTKSTYTSANWDFAGEIANGVEDIWAINPNSYPHFFESLQSPVLSTVRDIPGDQGHQVELVWLASENEAGYSLDYFYSVWRLVEDTRSVNTNSVIDGLSSEIDDYTGLILHQRDDYWTFLTMVPAMMFDQYSVIVPTLVDSCATMNEEEYSSTYMVCFHHDTGIYMSEDVSGYSVDNIAPYATSDVTLTVGGRTENCTLYWSEVTEGEYNGNSYPEQNGLFYRVYAGDSPDFECNVSSLLGTTQELSMDIDTNESMKFFKVVVSDQP